MTFISLIPSIYVNVKQYGAKGDGVTDDTTAIQNAINAATVGSGIFFPGGTYLVSSTIQLVAQLAYLGTTGSYGGSIIKQKNSSNLAAVLAAYEWYNNNSTCGNPVRIENLTIDCNSANNTTSHGIVLMNFDSIIRECTIINAPGCGIVISSINQAGSSISNTAVENRIESCKVTGAGTHGIWVHDTGGKTTDGYIDSCIVSGTTQDGIHLDRASGWFLQHNHTYATAMNAYNVNNCFNTFIIGNEVDGYGTTATAGYYSGISAALIGPRATVITDNLIAVNYESNSSSVNYQHLNVTGNGVTDTKAIVVGNAVLGGYVSTTATTSISSGTTAACTPASMDGIFVGQSLVVGSDTITVGATTATTFSPSSNWPSNHGPSSYSITANKSQSTSTGLVYQSSSTQQSSGQLCTIISYGNRVEQSGHYSFFDGIALVGPMGVDGTIALSQPPSYAIPTLANTNTISTIGLGSITVTATSNVNGIILQAGTQAGQFILINNESAFTIQFASSNSNVAAAASEVIQANSQRIYVWDSNTNLWYGPASVGQQSATAAATANSGTITTAGVDQARVAPTGNITGVILQAGTYANQSCVVVNESAFTVTFAASGTSHVADGTSAVIAATRCMIFRWDSGTSLWYHA